MGNSEGKLNIVNENDEIIGEETRKDIHTKGLLHRQIHVWLYTKQAEIVFQKRSLTKEVYPGLLDATVGGHVEIGMNYEESALKELYEETGIKGMPDQLHLLKKIKAKGFDPSTQTINNIFQVEFAYPFNGALDNLIIEEGETIEFQLWPIEKILNITQEEKKLFDPTVFSDDILDAIRLIKELI